MVIADRIVLMRNGVIEQIGAPTDLYNRPATRFAAEFVGLANIYAAESNGSHARLKETDIELAHAAAPRGAVDVVVRPEHVRVSANAFSGPNVFECKVKDSYFLGNMTDLILTFSGHELRAQPSPAQYYAPGTTLWAHLPPESLILLPHAS